MEGSIYINESKRHWRYWVWKRIKSRLQILPCQATVFFLSGPSPEDLEAATKYGFKLKNIVAVDIDEDAVKLARKAGCTAICGDLHEIVTQWDDGDIHGIVADYCVGLTASAANKSIEMSEVVDGAVCFNFQRGREGDAASSAMRGALSKLIPNELHRGKQFAAMYAAFCALVYMTREDDTVVCDRESPEMWSSVESIVTSDVFNLFFNRLNDLEYNTYRSSRVLMDSIVGRVGFTTGRLDIKEVRRNNQEYYEDGIRLLNMWDQNANASRGEKDVAKAIRKLRSEEKTRKRIVACKAIRTMRNANK